MSSNETSLRDVTNEKPSEYPLSEKRTETFDYLLEQVKGIDEQIKDMQKARNVAVAMLNDVLGRELKDNGLDPAEWELNIERKTFVPKEKKDE